MLSNIKNVTLKTTLIQHLLDLRFEEKKENKTRTSGFKGDKKYFY